MNFFITSDHHFSHQNICNLCSRPFSSVEEMDKIMISNWNGAVKKEDIVYHLGDLFWNDKSARQILPLLNGTIYLLLGNHDKRWKQSRKRLQKSPIKPDSNLIILEKDIFEINTPIPAVLCHYPLMSWNRAHYGIWHFHGHTHNNNCLSEGKRINVCVENTNYTPINLKDFMEKKNE